MNKREMAKRLREWAQPATHYDDAATCEAAAAALEREAEREEQEWPKVTLAQMAEACSYASGLACGPHVAWLDLATATLRKLDEEGGKLLAELDRMIAAKRAIECVTWRPTAALLRALSVEPKP